MTFVVFYILSAFLCGWMVFYTRQREIRTNGDFVLAVIFTVLPLLNLFVVLVLLFRSGWFEKRVNWK